MTAMSDWFEEELVDQLFRTGTSVADWAASTAYSLGDRVVATTFDGNIYECTTAGTSGGSEPTWNTTLGVTTTDNTATWTAYKPGVLKRPIYIALFGTSASLANLEAGTLTGEISGGSYARLQKDPADATWSAPSGGNGTTDNVAAFTFTTATADWGTVRYVAGIDASSSGNVVWYAQLAADRTVNNGDTFQFDAGNLDIVFA